MLVEKLLLFKECRLDIKSFPFCQACGSVNWKESFLMPFVFMKGVNNQEAGLLLLASNLTFWSEILALVGYLLVLSVAKQQICDSTNSEISESVQYEPLSQQGRYLHWEMAFFFSSERAALAMKIDEGKHCSWLLLSGEECRGPCRSVGPLKWQ